MRESGDRSPHNFTTKAIAQLATSNQKPSQLHPKLYVTQGLSTSWVGWNELQKVKRDMRRAYR
ncbi:hypothetical protein [Fischerella sp. PCC 9605]|uniref:hypothetical protein n=1 Tax=Fischerella sp. PCC 9605 TaxID=1173024 RepID=UPI0004B4025D|nr:hypothetical protein [Fischerella sp. PCC 9605]